MIRIYTLYVALLLCVTLESARASGPDAWSVDSFHYRFSSLEDENIEIRFIFQSKAGENLVGDVRHPQWGRALKEVQIKSKKFELTIPEEEARCIFVGEIESVNLFFEGRKKTGYVLNVGKRKKIGMARGDMVSFYFNQKKYLGRMILSAGEKRITYFTKPTGGKPREGLQEFVE